MSETTQSRPETIEGKAPLYIIIATVVIDMLGVGLAWPILPQLVKELSGASVGEAAWIYGLLTSGFALVQFTFGPAMGMISDKYGRRPVLLLSLLGLGISYLVLALAPSMLWLVIGRLIAGLFSATVSTANAYIADITPPEKRAGAFGLLGAAFGIGFIAGPLIGGVLGAYDLRYAFWLAAALSFANAAFGYFYLPESLPPSKRSHLAWGKANPFSALAHIRRYDALILLMTALVLTGIAQNGLQVIWVLWTEAQFNWGVAEAGYSLAWVGVCMAVVQGWLVRVVVPAFGEWKVLVGGYLISFTAFIFLPFVTAGWVLYPGILFHIIGWGCAGPVLTALMSRNVPEDEQGLLQGTISSVNTVALIIGPLLASDIFARSTGPDAIVDNPGAFYWFGAVLFAITIALVVRELKRMKPADHNKLRT
ncbi:MAG: MFS transporter [Pseudomonadota bacterium]